MDRAGFSKILSKYTNLLNQISSKQADSATDYFSTLYLFLYLRNYITVFVNSDHFNRYDKSFCCLLDTYYELERLLRICKINKEKSVKYDALKTIRIRRASNDN